MENESSLRALAAAWCQRAERTVQNPPTGCRECMALVREGILLRRRWDRTAPESPYRREMLRLLPAAQNLAQQRLGETLKSAGRNPLQEPVHDKAVVELVDAQLDEDDRYLAGLLSDENLSTESAALAIECFRDDLHWLGTQAAVLDGSQGVDFLGRILLEQEALEREMDAWEGDSVETVELRHAARRLRDTALVRQIESLVRQPEPRDAAGWYRRWQAASRLTMRVAATGDTFAATGETFGQGPGLSGQGPWAEFPNPSPSSFVPTPGPWPLAPGPSLDQIRTDSARRWRLDVVALPPPEADAAAGHAAQDLSDAAIESLTFLEDLPLSSAVGSLEILEADLTTCLDCAQSLPDERTHHTRRLLERRRRAVAAELQDRRLALRMERLFGRRFVAGLERLILFLLVFFVIVLAVEAPLLKYEAACRGISPQAGQSVVEPVLAWIDFSICVVFIAEFTLKISLAERRWLYLKRNWAIGLLPAIPVGFLAYATNHPLLAEGGDWFVSLRFLRYLRLPYFARWLRVARPVLRFVRLIGFMIRASDRLVRQMTPVLNRNLLLFERGAIQVHQPPYRAKLAALRERFYHRATELIHDLPQAAGRRVAKSRIDDLTAMLSSPDGGRPVPPVTLDCESDREIPLERTIAWLLAATPAGISDRIGRTLASSVTRWSRAFDVFVVRRLPLVRDLVTAGRLPSPYDTTARVANRIGLVLKHLLDRVYWLADLYGTVTAPQLVDSLGETMVKGAARPARRLVLLGAAFLAVTYLFSWLSYWVPVLNLESVSKMLRDLIGWPLVALGCLCLVVFGLGAWFRRVAGEATDFYTQVAQAQFISATRRIKQRLMEPYRSVLQRRVIAAELAIAAAEGGCPDQPHPENDAMDQIEGAKAAVDLLWRDFLDGAPFLPDDTRTTNQLLGNLVLVSLRETRLHYNRQRRKRLRRLDLTAGRTSVRGPYLWFHFISRSLAHQTARLVVDYNAYALPLSRAATADGRAVVQYVQWLSRRLRTPVDQLDLPDEFRRRLDEEAQAKMSDGLAPKSHAPHFDGNDFTAIHFFSADADLEADVRRRYGDQVARLMRRDRRDNIRRVFRTYPFHHWPKEQRTFNPLTLYQRHLAGGRVLFVPFTMLWWTTVWLARAMRLLWLVIEDLLEPSVGEIPVLEDFDPFEVALRKIHRMRKPLLLECLRMRAEFDPEYLGVMLPGRAGGGVRAERMHAVRSDRIHAVQGRATLSRPDESGHCERADESGHYERLSAAVEIEDDLKTIRAEPGVRSEFRRLAALRHRQLLEFRYWLDRFGGAEDSSAPSSSFPRDLRSMPGRSLRAMALAYVVDYREVRSRLEAVRGVERALTAAGGPAPASRRRLAWPHRVLWRRWRLGGMLDRLFQLPTFARFDDAQKAACRRLVLRGDRSLPAAVKRLADVAAGPFLGGDPVEDARAVLAKVGRDPDPWSRQLVVLRAVQTLSVLDLKAYCELVAELGEYDTGAGESSIAVEGQR